MGLPGAALSISISEWAAAATYLALGWSKRSQLGLDKGWVVAGNTRKTSTTLIGSSSSSSSSKDANSEGASTSLALETVASSSSCSSSNGREGIQPQRNPATPTSAATNITSTAFRTFAASYAPFLQVRWVNLTLYPGLDHAFVCLYQCAFDTSNARIKCPHVEVRTEG